MHNRSRQIPDVSSNPVSLNFLHQTRQGSEIGTPGAVRHRFSRRDCLLQMGAVCGGLAVAARPSWSPGAEPHAKAMIAITFDLEMSRNFPNWEDTHWDYEKGDLDTATKEYSEKAAARVKKQGGHIHFFCVGRVLEQPNVDWLKRLAETGHPIGNHTYDHVNIRANQNAEIQPRFQRAPWLIAGRSPQETIRENIRLTTLALKERLGIDNCGFRAPGGFPEGLIDRPDLQQALLEAGFKWISSKYPSHGNSLPGQAPTERIYESILQAHNRTQPFIYPSGLVEIPMSPISDIAAFRNGRWKLDWFLESLRRIVLWTIKNKAVFDFLAHPSCLGVVDPKLQAIELICDLVDQARDGAQLVNLNQIFQNVKDIH